MSWKTITVAMDELVATLQHIRQAGSTITHCTPRGGTYEVTFCCRKGAA